MPARRAQQGGVKGKGDAAGGAGQARKQSAASGMAQGEGGAPKGGDALGADRPGAGDDGEDDGYQLVRPRGWRKRRGATQDQDAEGTARAGGGAEGAATVGEDTMSEDEAGEEVDGEGPPSPGTLRRAWLDEVAVVRRLKQQGLAADHPAMRAACGAREAAEREWREAKDPAPAAVRLARAQAKLDRAIDLQGEVHKELTDYQAAHAEKLAALQARLGEARERVSLRRSQLEEIRDEVGAEGQGGRARAEQGEAARKVHATLCSTVAPTIAALVEQLESSTPAWTVLNGLLGTLSDSLSLLAMGFPPGATAPVCYSAGGVGGGGDGECSEWSESHDLAARGGEQGQGAGGGGIPVGGTRDSTWGGGVEGRDGGGDHDLSMGTGEWWDSPNAEWAPGARWEACGHGKWARATWAEAWEQEQEGEGSATARRRLEPAPPAPASASDAAGGGSPADAQQRKKQHEERVQRIVLAAIDAGVQPITPSGQELHMLDPHALDAWVAEHLPEGGKSR